LLRTIGKYFSISEENNYHQLSGKHAKASNPTPNVCAPLEVDAVKSFLDYEILLATHNWKLNSAGRQGDGDMLVMMKCLRCGVDRLGMLSVSKL